MNVCRGKILFGGLIYLSTADASDEDCVVVEKVFLHEFEHQIKGETQWVTLD